MRLYCCTAEKQIGKDQEAETHLSDVLSYASSALLQIGDLLVPFLPSIAARIHSTFGTGKIVIDETVSFPKIYIHTPNPAAKKV